MSRCFPYPPPGYEAKPRSEHKDLLKKEKHKDKKHKKERKHKEKKERKEKVRDHRGDKHSKKHERKRDRDRRKDKDRDGDNKRTLQQGTEKKYDINNRRPKESVQNEVDKDRPVDDLVTQIIGQEGHADNAHSGSSTRRLLPRSTESFGSAGSKKKERTSLSRVGEKSGRATQHNHASGKVKDTVHGSKSRIQNGKIQAGSAEKHSSRSQGSNGVGLQQEKFAPKSHEDVASTRIVPGSGKGLNGRITTPSPHSLQRTEQVDQHKDSSSHSAYVESDNMISKGMTEKEKGSANNFDTSMDQQLVRGKDGTVQSKAKLKEVKSMGNHDKDIRDTDRDHNVKKRKGKDKHKEKEKENISGINDQKHKELDECGASKNGIDDLVSSAHLNKNSTYVDVKKRKDPEANDSLHGHGMRMAKLARMSPANHPCVNGVLKHSGVTTPCFSTVPVGKDTREADVLQDNKECYSNGITGAHYSKKHIASVPSPSLDSNEVSLKPHHPDINYLSNLYSIPAVDDCSGYVDQGWLFSGDRVEQKTVMPKVAESPQVWSEAQLIGSADITALPYVVPL